MTKHIIIFIFFFPSLLFSQVSAISNDYNTPKKKMVQSQWDKLISNSDFKLYFRISAIGNYSFMDVRIAKNNTVPFKIEHGQELVFYFPHSDSLIINNSATVNSCIGCGSVFITSSQFSGIEVSYILTKKEVEKLETFIPSQVYVNTSSETLKGEITTADYNKILKAIIITED